MALNLDLPAKLETYLLEVAKQQGLSMETDTLHRLENYLLLAAKRIEAARLLQSWIDHGDMEEQQETGQYLIRSLDEGRLPSSKLFPPEMKGITW